MTLSETAPNVTEDAAQGERTGRDWLASGRLLVTGFVMGAADIVPGVSGGTVAFVAGIYAELLRSIKTVTSTTPRLLLQGRVREALASIPFGFLIPLGVGVLVAGFSLANLLTWLLKNEPVYVWAFFFGLVGASVVFVLRQVKLWSWAGLGLFGLSLAGAYALTSLTALDTPATPLAFFASGMVAVCAMILPGISGSFLLVVLGKYEQVLEAVAQRDIITLLPLFVGAAVGIALFSRVLTYLMARHRDLVILALAGLMLGSMPRIWPWKDVAGVEASEHDELVLSRMSQQPNVLPDSLSLETLAALLLILAGAGIIGLARMLVWSRESGE